MTALAPLATSPAAGLVCRNCTATYPLGAQHACFECFGPLEVDYDPDLLARVSRADIEAGPHSLWRYAGLLPVGQDAATRVESNTGMTPLIRADRLADELGFTAPVWIKDDSANPTHSFKDRVVSVAITAARELGFTRIACASTGNLGNSVAAHAARIGMPSIVFVPADLEAPKIVQSAIYGGTLVGIEGSYDDVNRLCSQLSEEDEFGSRLRQREHPAVLRRGVQDARLRGGGAARLAPARRSTSRRWRPGHAHEDQQGLQGAGRRGAGRRCWVAGVRSAVGGVCSDRDGVLRRVRTRSCR